MAPTAVRAAEPSTAHVDFYVIWHSAWTPGEPVLSLHHQHWHSSANAPRLEKSEAAGKDVLIKQCWEPAGPLLPEPVWKAFGGGEGWKICWPMSYAEREVGLFSFQEIR